MKRILSLDGGGVRSFFTLQVLEKVESILRERNDDPEYRLCQHFDLIAGTSAGAIIGSLLSWGLSVKEVKQNYDTCIQAIFQKAQLTQRHKYQYTDLVISRELQRLFTEHDGSLATLGSSSLKSLLLIVLRNATTGSPWPLCNNPKATFNDRSLPDCNLDLPLWQLIRASSAAPTYFPCERIALGAQTFEFIDGGISPYNNPSFLAYQIATLPCYRIDWETDPKKLFLLSIGVGQNRPRLPKINHQSMHLLDHAQHVVGSLMHSATVQQDFACRTVARTLFGAKVDTEIGDLIESPPRMSPHFSYTRYDTQLVQPKPSLKSKLESFALDDLNHIKHFIQLGADYANQTVSPQHIL